MRGTSAAKKARKEYKGYVKSLQKLTGLEIEGEIAVALISNPAVIGSVMYVLVGLMKRGQSTGKPLSLPGWLTLAIEATPFAAILNLTGNDPVGLDALQAALLLYIGTGGNPTGVLSSLSGLIKALPTP